MSQVYILYCRERKQGIVLLNMLPNSSVEHVNLQMFNGKIMTIRIKECVLAHNKFKYRNSKHQKDTFVRITDQWKRISLPLRVILTLRSPILTPISASISCLVPKITRKANKNNTVEIFWLPQHRLCVCFYCLFADNKLIMHVSNQPQPHLIQVIREGYLEHQGHRKKTLSRNVIISKNVAIIWAISWSILNHACHS